MTINLFDTDIELREKSCALNGNCPSLCDSYVNIYVRLEEACNASCDFCEFRGQRKEFDFFKLYYVLMHIAKKTRINKVSFTGGEPTMNIDTLNKCLEMVKEIDKKIFTVINTNGYQIDKIKDLKLVDSIALSRHHYSDEINQQLFKTKVLSFKEIELLNQNYDNKIHLSCNLVKGYIDNKDEIMKYLDAAAEHGINDVGFVSLMSVNKFCVDHLVDFSDIDMEDPSIIINKEWNNEDRCKCRNHMYIASNGNLIDFYSRFYMNGKNNSSSLVYDLNCLKDGFNGKIIF